MIPPGHKYACFVFRRFPTGGDLQEPLQLADGLWALRRPPVDPDQYWREWLGSIRLDAVRDANFALLAVVRSERPEVLDGEPSW